MPRVPCPKPGCGWSVDAAAVPAGRVIACPTCGQRFRLAVPTGQPTGSPNTVGSSLLTVGGVVVVVLLIAGAVATALLVKRRPGGGTPGPLVARTTDADRNFEFTPPGEVWTLDRDGLTALGVNVLALRRTRAGPEVWAALAVKDFGSRVPLASEMRDQVTATLGRVFDNLPAEPSGEPTTWVGRPASVWKFRGQHKTTGTICAGEAVAMTHRGVGYWCYGWAAERDFDPADLQTVRDGLRLLDGRADWRPTAASETTFRGPAGGYRLTAFEKIWEPVPPATGTDLELKAVLKGRGNRDFPPRAAVRVWRVSDPGDPAVVAEAVVRKESTRDPTVFGPTEFADLPDPPAGDAPPGPESPATPVRRLRVTAGSDDSGKSMRLVAYSGIRVGGDVVVAEAACPWDEREAWERRLVQLVGSLRE